jgi:hypothetical protein
VDIVDQHGLYQGQARKRGAFYKECGYRLLVQTFQEGAFNELLEVKSKEAKTTTAKTKSKTPTIVDTSDSEGSLELLSEEED